MRIVKVLAVEDRLQRTLAVELTALEQRCEDLDEKCGRADTAIRRLADIVATVEIVAKSGQTRSAEVRAALRGGVRIIQGVRGGCLTTLVSLQTSVAHS